MKFVSHKRDVLKARRAMKESGIIITETLHEHAMNFFETSTDFDVH